MASRFGACSTRPQLRLRGFGRRRRRAHFVTDTEMVYHLYYFGREPTGSSLTPEERVRGRRVETIPLGLEQEYSFSVCLDDGFCKVLSAHTRIRGEGRLDIELEGARRLLVEVAEAGDDAPVELAQVLIDGPGSAMVFENGEVSWSKPKGAEGSLWQQVRTGARDSSTRTREARRYVSEREGYRAPERTSRYRRRATSAPGWRSSGRVPGKETGSSCTTKTGNLSPEPFYWRSDPTDAEKINVIP